MRTIHVQHSQAMHLSSFTHRRSPLFRAAWLFCVLGVVLETWAAGSILDLRVTVVAGERYYSLKDLASVYSLTFRVPPGRSVYLHGKWNQMDFEVDSRMSTINGTAVWLHKPVIRNRGKWLISEADARKSVDPLIRPSEHLSRKGTAVVVLDPGHGGHDKGAVGRRSVEEKRVVQDIARRVRGHLANAGLKVYLTRDTDRFIPLTDRTAKASQWGADVFVSIHLNSAVSRTAKGVETYVIAAPGCSATAAQTVSRGDQIAYAGNLHDEANVVLGYFLQKALVQKTNADDRGLRRARFMVLRNAPCPAALVECGFVSNAAEETLILKPEYREKLALALTQGILDYVKAVRQAKVSRR